MKIVFLNTWNGRVREEIAEFIKQQARDTDLFCFQEVHDEMMPLCRDILPNYKEFSSYKSVTDDDYFLQATYVKEGIGIISSGVLLEREPDCGLGLYVEVRTGSMNQNVFICNFHGISRPVDKLDNPSRLNQSRALIEFFGAKEGLKIIGGDFNILPETKSIKMFEMSGYSNLVKDFEIKTTRNRLAWDMYPGSKQYYADYVFIDQDVKLQEFSVPNNEVSDHLPLIVVIEAN